MEKEILLSGFNEKIGNPDENGFIGETGISQRTLEAYVDSILPEIASDDMVNDSFYDRHVNFLKSVGGQLRHEKSEFVKKYKPQGQVKTTEQSKPGNEVVEQLLASNKELADQLKEAVKAVSDIKKERESEKAAEKTEMMFKNAMTVLRNKIESVGGVVNDGVLSMAKMLTTLSEGMDDVALQAALQSNYESQYKAVFGNGSSPLISEGEKGGKSYIDRLKERDKVNGEMMEKVRSELK